MEISDKDKARFEAKINKTEGCWLWTASLNTHNYGQFYYNNTMIEAHRLSYKIYKGDIPKGLQVAHGECHNTICVNPTHLSLKTAKENAADKLRDGTTRWGEEHPQAKLTAIQVLEIKRLLTLGELTQLEIGKMFGVARQTITNINTAKNRWSSLKPEDG
jgi:hypothetical protein